MKLYDETIKTIQALMGQYQLEELDINSKKWPKDSDRTMILRGDMAYELGADLLPGIGATIVTANEDLVSKDGLFLIGKDLQDIKADSPFARISLVRVNEDTLGQGEKLYKAIRDLEYTRYHYYPKGFMMRVSGSKGKESVRVSKDAIKSGIDFSQTGSQMIEAFRENGKVLAVEQYYVTLDSFDYKRLEGLCKEAETITQAIDHMLKNILMDCGACSLQKVCDEVEGMRELHFNKQNS